MNNIHQLVNQRDLLYMLTRKEIRIRYKQSVMGFLWALLMPVLIVGAGMLMKQAYAFASHTRLDLSDLLSVSVKAVMWSFFAGAVKFGSNSLIANMNLVTKIYFPREVLPLSSVFRILLRLSHRKLVLSRTNDDRANGIILAIRLGTTDYPGIVAV